MKALCQILKKIHCQNISSDIQSGSLSFSHEVADATGLSQLIVHKVQQCFGFSRMYCSQQPFCRGRTRAQKSHVLLLQKIVVEEDLLGYA
jgi:hypothetical protein